MIEPACLCSVLRGEIPEIRHYGWIIHLNKKKIFNMIGDFKDRLFFYRSCAKPIQASLLIDYNVIDYFKMTKQEIAICCASQIADDEHLKVLRGFFKKLNINSSVLKCGIHQPISRIQQRKLLKTNEKPNIFHHNCLGKHLGMIAICIKNGWNINNYNDFEHPLQKKVKDKVIEFCEYKNPQIAIDDCNLPTFALPLNNLGVGFINLFSNPKYEIIKNSILENPFLIGGKNRVDSEIMNMNKNLIAKLGAGGLIIVYNKENQEAIAVKIADGNENARFFVTISILEMICWLPKNSLASIDAKKIFTSSIFTSNATLAGGFKLNFDVKPSR